MTLFQYQIKVLLKGIWRNFSLFKISAKEDDPLVQDDEIDMGEEEDIDVESDDDDIDTKAEPDDQDSDEPNEMR